MTCGPGSTTQNCETRGWKIRYSRRSDTTEIIQGAGGHQSLLVSGMCSILEPHSARAVLLDGLARRVDLGQG
jgi:hypothetical protein